MNSSAFLKTATLQLEKAGVATARLEAIVLLGDVLYKNSAQVLAEPELVLLNEQISTLNEQIERRVKHEPLAYIRGKTEFYGREFVVNKHVLEPRPETETMIDLLKKLPSVRGETVIDVGTGSGAIAITAACELHEVHVIATDIDPSCLEVAQTNADKHQATITFVETNLLKGVELPADSIILANLPYVPNNHTINEAAMHEPKLAIFGGEDGLDLYRTMFTQLKNAKHMGYVLAESLPPQHTALAKIAASCGYKLQTSDDFIQVFTN